MAEMMSKERQDVEQAAGAVQHGVEEATAGEPTKAVMRMQEEVPISTYMYATGASILASLLLFFRNKENGIFVGLWAPTILNMALLYKLFKPSKGNV